MGSDHYDSRVDTLKHSQRVGELMMAMIKGMLDRSTCHDRSKTESPEVEVFDEYTPKLKAMTYGSDEYKACLEGMGEGLKHHYAKNAHHPEFGESGLEWRAISGYEGYYEISNYGDVRSVDRVIDRKGPTGKLTRRGEPRKAHVTPKGYLRLMLSKNSVQNSYLVHRLVAQAFLSDPEDESKVEINHKNGRKKDNRATNLEWATPSENQLHAYSHGLKISNAKYIVHCPELDLTTIGAEAMARHLRGRGNPKANGAGIWSAMDRKKTYLGLTFEGTLLTEYGRNRLAHMTLMDLVEMLADWKAATERMAHGSLERSLTIQKSRFGIDEQIIEILENTAREYGWLDTVDGD